MSNTNNEDLNRALGRIEGANNQILEKVIAFQKELGDHRQDDQRNFSSFRALLDRKISDQDTQREAHLKLQDAKLDQLKQDQDKAKGAGWVIISLLGALATFAGGAVIAALGGHIRIM